LHIIIVYVSPGCDFSRVVIAENIAKVHSIRTVSETCHNTVKHLYDSLIIQRRKTKNTKYDNNNNNNKDVLYDLTTENFTIMVFNERHYSRSF